jgi:carnitine 3-dehydrogenase
MSTSDDAVLPPNSVTRVASLGGGVIGQSWTALFLAAGKSVAVYDPDPATEKRVRQAIETAWPALVELGLAEHGNPDNVSFCDDARAAVEGAEFVQESVPEQIDIKHELYATTEPALGATTIVASSASGLTLKEMQGVGNAPTGSSSDTPLILRT